MPALAIKKTKKERITFYAPPKIFEILTNIVSSGRYANQGEAICAAIMAFGNEIQKYETSKIVDTRFNDMEIEMQQLHATIDVLSDRLSLVEQKYSLLTLAVGEKETEYRHKKTGSGIPDTDKP